MDGGGGVAAVIAFSVSHSTQSLSAAALRRLVLWRFLSTSSCCPRGAERPAVSRPEKEKKKKEKKQRRVKINSSLN